MNRGAVFFIMLLFFLYFSLVTGKIIADVDSSFEGAEEEGYENSDYSPNFDEPNKQISFYLNPFHQDVTETEYADSEQGESIFYRSEYTPAAGGNAFQGYVSDSEINNSAPAGSVEISFNTTMKSGRKSSRESMYFGDGYNNPFGGLISQINQVEKNQLSSTSTNPTGTFGMKLGIAQSSDYIGFEDKTLSAPLDSGVYFLLFACIAAGGYFISKKIAFIKIEDNLI